MDHDIDYYLQNPNELPNDPDALAALAAGSVKMDVMGVPKQAETAQATPPAGEPAPANTGEPAPVSGTAAAESATAGAGQNAEVAAPIEARDGKHTIPYSVLEGERTKRQQAEQMIQQQAQQMTELQKQMEALSAQVKAGNVTPQQEQAAADAAQAAQSGMSAEMMTQLEQDFPVLAQLFKSQQATINQLAGTVQELNGRHQQEVATEQRTVAQQIRDAIDANANLAHWEANNPAAWKLAQQFDNVMRANPEFANLNFADRFSKVEAQVLATMGPQIAVAKHETLREKAQEIVNQTAPAAPNSLSDFRGTEPPPTSETQKLTNQSAAEIGNMFNGMTPDQLTSYLASL